MIAPHSILISRIRLILFALPLFLIALVHPATDGAFAANQNDGTVILRPYRSQAAPLGDVKRGHDLFMGSLHFQNEGPPCMGCHNVGKNGLLGGGALGPDLTNVSVKRSQYELQTILSNSEVAKVPVMQPIYAEHPLTGTEQADLLAFLNASVGQPETNQEWLVISISLLGFLAAVGCIELIYHRRLRGVRKQLIRNAHSRQ